LQGILQTAVKPLDGTIGLEVVWHDLMPNRRVKESQTDEQNWLPLSEVIC
jgi:hypothetical protein